MTIRASSGTAPGSLTAARNDPGAHNQAALAGAVTTGAGLRRYASRDLWAVAAAIAGALAVSRVLLPLRSCWSNTSVALLLVVMVGAAAATGNRFA